MVGDGQCEAVEPTWAMVWIGVRQKVDGGRAKDEEEEREERLRSWQVVARPVRGCQMEKARPRPTTALEPPPLSMREVICKKM